MLQSPAERLEAYSDKHQNEVLLVDIKMDGELDCVLVFRGYSSSLMRPTATDLSVPVIPSEAEIETVSRLQAPYQPDAPHYLDRDVDWPSFETQLTEWGF